MFVRPFVCVSQSDCTDFSKLFFYSSGDGINSRHCLLRVTIPLPLASCSQINGIERRSMSVLSQGHCYSCVPPFPVFYVSLKYLISGSTIGQLSRCALKNILNKLKMNRIRHNTSLSKRLSLKSLRMYLFHADLFYEIESL